MMDVGRKLVSVVLLLGMAVAPAAALADCRTATTDDPQHACPPGCAMMAGTVAMPAASIEAQSPASTCCRISPGRPVPATQLLAPAGASRIAPPAAPVSAVPDAVAPLAIHSADAAPPPAVAPSQSVLCTFLI